MKLTHYIYISTALAMLTACGEDIEPVYTVGEADNAIVLSAGVADGMPKTQTRGATRAAGDPTYVAFQTGTKMALRVEGTWLGHGDTYNKIYSPSPTTGTIKDVSDSDKDLDPSDSDNNKDTRGVTLSPQLYWDDYGTADPKNIDTDKGGEATAGTGGRQKGLTIYGVAVDGEPTAPTFSDWASISWDVGTPGVYIDQNTDDYWKSKDLLTSNNISGDNTLKFDTRTTENNILYFTHEMTKITVKLTAGAGFNSKFAENPSVRLNGFYYKGTVNAIAKTSTPTTTETTDIEMKLSEGGKDNPTATLTALVFPGNKFSDTDNILTLSADGNKYFVTAAKLNAAIQTAINNKATTKYPGTDKTLLHAYNYILNITVNKTAISVEATIVDWEKVEAAEDAPKINVNSSYGKKVGDDNNGNKEKAFEHNFDFYRSTDIVGSYLETGNHKVVKYSNDGGTISYTMGAFDASNNFIEEKMYWPNHSIHYFFRGLYPVVDNSVSSSTPVTNTAKIPSDYVTNKSDEKTSYIKVGNTEYLKDNFPSDLMLAMPITTDDLCGNPEHKDSNGQYKVSEHGICATEGVIRMNFRYMMSQVKVELSSSQNSTDEDYVDFSKGVTVEILNGNTEGAVLMKDGTVDFSIIDAKKGSYQMTDKTTGDPAAHNSFHDAIIPQSLTNGSDLLRFKITVTKEDGSKDVYETVQGIKDIEVYEWDYTANVYSSTSKKIEAWEAGKFYTYKLKIQKTGIKITATMADWIPVLASTDIWL